MVSIAMLGPWKIEKVGDTVGEVAMGRQGDRGGAIQVGIKQQVLLVHGADEHADLALVALLQALASMTGVLEQVPDGLEEQPFLRDP